MKLLLRAFLFSSFAVVCLQASPLDFVNDKIFSVQVMGNLMIATDAEETIIDGTGNSTRLKDPWGDGAGLSIAGGCYVANGLHVALEYSYRTVNVNNFHIVTPVGGVATVQTGRESGNLTFKSLMLNATYEIYMHDRAYWYLGGGIGASRVDANDSYHKTVFAWQVMTGVGFYLTDHLSLLAGYRMFATKDIDERQGSMRFDCEVPMMNLFEIGLRYDL